VDDLSLPAAESCVHNLHREPYGSSRKRAEATDLCRSPIGMVHMVDCPINLGRPCTFYAAASDEVEALSDEDVVRQRTLLHADYMRWSYRRRVHALRKPVGFLPERRAVEIVPDPEIEPGVDLVFARVEALEAEEASVPVPDTLEGAPEERYPGQRRSEDRRSRPTREPHAHRDAEGPTHCCDDEPERDEFPEVGAAPQLPKTIDELFDALPEAVLPERPAERERRTRRRRTRPSISGSAPRTGPRPSEGGAKGPESPDPGSRRRRGRRGTTTGAPGTPGPREKTDADRSGDAGHAEQQKRRRRRRRPQRPGGPPSAPSP
jgi:hypothetical protein